MAENVGTVEIKLLLNRDDFDLEVLALSQQAPLSVAVRAGLDTRRLESDLKALNSRTIDVRLNTDAISNQLDQALTGRTVAVRLRLDATGFKDDLRVLTADRQVSVGVSLDDRFDSQALDLRIKTATRDRTVRVFGVADFADLNQSLAALDSRLNRSLSPTVDDRALTRLNEHLSLKQAHWAQVRADFSKPIKPSVDDSGLSSSDSRSPISIAAVVQVDRSQIEALAGQTITVKLTGDTTELKRNIESVSKSNVSIGAKSAASPLSLNPFKFVGGIGSNIISGALSGVGMELSKSLGGGISKAIEGAISGTFGSTELLGSMLGKKLTGSIGGGINKSSAILKSLEEYVDKIEPETPEGLKRKRQIKQVISQVQEAPQRVADSLNREVGSREISREQVLRRGAVSDQRKVQDAVVSTQADTEYQERARELAVSSARKAKLDTKANKQIESKSERLGVISSDLEPLKADIQAFNQSLLGQAVSAQSAARSALSQFKPRAYSKKEINDANNFGESLPTPLEQKQVLINRVSTSDKAVKSLQFTGQSASDKAFERLDKDSGKSVAAFVPLDLIAGQKAKLAEYKKLLQEGKQIEKEVSQLKLVKQTAAQSVEKDEFQAKLSDSFRIAKPLEVQRAESSANMERLGNADEIKRRLEASRDVAESSLKVASGNSLESAKAKVGASSEESSRAEARRSNVIQARRAQFQNSVESNAPIKDVEALRDKLEKSESRTGRVPALKVKESQTRAALNAQLGKIAALKSEIATTEDAIAEITDLQARTVAEFNAVVSQRNIKSKKKESIQKPQQTTPTPIAVPESIKAIEKAPTPIAVPEAIKTPSPQLGDLTRAQLFAVAKQEGVQGVTASTKKADLVGRIYSGVSPEKLGPIVSNIDSTFDKQGKPVKGYDTAKESAVIAQIKQQERAINDRIAQAKKLRGIDRINALESLNIESSQFITQLEKLKATSSIAGFSGPTMKTIGSTQGRVSASISSKPETAESRDNRLKATAESMRGPTYGRSFAELVDTASVAQPGQSQSTTPLRLARVSRANLEPKPEPRRPFLDLSVKAAEFFGAPAGNSIKQNLGAIPRTDKARGMFSEAAIAGAGMVASSAASGNGSIAGGAASIGATLITRLAIESGAQYSSAIKRLKQQESFLKAGLIQKAKMLAAAAKEINLNNTGDAITGDIAGFTIGTAGAALKTGLAASMGLPMMNQLPLDAIAATFLPGKVMDIRKRFAVARADEPQKEGLFDRIKNKANDLRPINNDRLQANYSAFQETYTKNNSGSAIGSLAPRLEVADKALKASGADALYDVDRNVVMVSKALALALDQPAHSLAKAAKKLEPLTHEIQHSNQFAGGKLNLEQASMGLGTPLSSKMDPKNKSAIDKSVSIAASQNPGLNKTQLRKLEIDAYAAESRTLGTLIEMQAKVGSKTPPLNAIGLKVSSIMDGIRNSVGNGVDNFRETILGQANVANISRTTRAYGQVDRSLGRRADRSSAMADAAFDESRTRSINSETTSTSADNTARASRFSSVARRLGLVPEGEARAVDAPKPGQSRASRIASEFQDVRSFVSGGIASVTSDVTKKDAKKLANTAVDARTLSFDIGTSQAIATRDGKTDDAKSLGKLRRRVDVTADRAERISGQDSFTGNDAKKISDLKSQFNEIYQMAGRPVPHPFEEMKGAAGGLIGNLKGVGLGLLALPFAVAGIGMALGMMKQFADASIQAAIASDRMKTSLTFSTGSKADGEKAFRYAADQASSLGIDRKASIEGYAKLRASSKGKLSEGQSNQLFEGVGSAATTLGLSAEDQSGVFLALGQIMSKGSVQAEELRGQIGERLPNAFAIAARSMSMSEAQLGKAMESGSVSAEQFIPKFGAQLKQEFGPGAKDASQNLQSSMFRLSGASGQVTENVGSALAVPVKFSVDAAIAGMTLLERHGMTLIGVIGVGLAQAAATGLSGIVASFGGLKAMGALVLETAGGISGIGKSMMSVAATVGPMIAQFLLINASIEIGKSLFSAFTPDDMGSRFEAQANKIKQSLDDIEKKGKGAKDSLSDVGPSKGIDIDKATFGLSGAVGIKKGDDLVKGINRKDEQGGSLANNGLFQTVGSLLLPPVAIITALGQKINESNGGEGLATMQEVQFNRSKIALGAQGDGVYGSTGKVFDSLPELRKKAAESQADQQSIDQKQVEKAKELSTGSPDKNKIARLDEEIKASANRRDKNGEGFLDQKNLIGSQITDLKAQKEGLKTNEDYSPNQKKELESQIDAQLGQLEGAKKQLDAIDKKFGGSADIMGKFNVSLSEMAAKIEAASAAAKNAFNSSEVKRLESRKADRGTDEFASQNNAVKQAENERTRAGSEFTGTKKTIDEINKVMEDPTVKREISKIAINGKSITGDTSAQELEQAKAGRTDKEKGQIDKLIARRKAIDSLPELKKNELESDEKVFGTKSALALEKNDRASKVREFENKGFEGKANVDFIKAQKGNKVNEKDVPVRQAEIGKIAADLQVSSIGESIKSLDSLFAAGTISKEEYTKRSMDLRSSLVDATTKAAQAELAVEQAKNRRILEDFELSIKKREVGRKEKVGAQTVGLINAQKGNRMNESDVAIKRAEISSTSAQGELSEVKQQMAETDALKARGIITEQEFTKRKLDLRSRLVDATIKAAEAELAIEQAKNKKILADWERNVKARELATKRVDTTATIDLIKGQANNNMSEDEVSIRKAENQGKSANSSASNIQSQLNELDGLRSTMTPDDYARKKMDLESQFLDAKVRSAEAELAIEQAKNRKIVNDYDKTQKEKIFSLGIKDKTDTITTKFNQLNGQIQGEGGQTEATKREIVSTRAKIGFADKAIDKDVELRNNGTISEKEFTDRVQNNANNLRSEEEKLVNLLIQERQGLYQKEHDALTRNTNVLIRGLEASKTRAGLESQLDGAKQGFAESAVGLGKAKADNSIAKIEAGEGESKSRDGKIANIRLLSLQAIQKAEMVILDLKEKQQQASLRQAAIEAQISFGKQKIAVSESQRKLKDALVTGDKNQIANATDDVTGQTQLLGLEGEKIRSLESQNQLSTAKMGIDRESARLNMDTELTRAQGAAKGFGGTQIQQNKVIGGGSFGGGIDLSALSSIGSQNNIKPMRLAPMVSMPIFDPLASQIQAPTAGIDRTVAQNAVPMALDDRNIVAAINKLGDRLDRLAPQKMNGDNRRMPGYSDQLEAQTANTYART